MTLDINTQRFFGSRTVQRGTDYFLKNRVRTLELDDEIQTITAKVGGSGKKVYHVEIDFERYTDDPDEDPFQGICSCPMQINCKHVCATLLAAERAYGSERINLLLTPHDTDDKTSVNNNDEFKQQLHQLIALAVDDIDPGASLAEKEALKVEMYNDILGIKVSEAPANTKPQQARIVNFEQKRRDKDRQNWLNSLQEVTRPTETSTRLLQSPKKNNINCLIYHIELAPYTGDLVIQPHTSRYLKNGGFGKSNIYRNAFNAVQYDNWPASVNEDDRFIFKMAYLHDRLEHYGSEIRLHGKEGQELLEKILATKRCLVDLESRTIINKGKPLKGEIRWQLDEQGLQHPALIDSDTQQPLQVLPTEPIYYLAMNGHQPECGELTGVPAYDTLKILLKAPPLDETGVEEVAEVLSELFNDKNTHVQIPEKISVLNVTPTPALILDGLPLPLNNAKSTNTTSTKATQILARARLIFTYANENISYGSLQDTIPAPEDSHQIIPRQQQTETRFFNRLPIELQPAYKIPMSGKGLFDHDLLMNSSSSDNQKHWLHFMNYHLPELEDQGWKITIEESFPFQFESLAEDDWYADLEESEMDWFNLRLGFVIDSKSIDLLPLLARQINQLPTLEALKKMPKGTLVPIALPGGKFINLPSERLLLIAGTLLELYGDRPLEEYRLQNHHAELWLELYEQLGLPWSGSEKLLELSRKLKSFKRLKKVNPAKTLQAKLRPYQQDGLSWLQFLREYGLNGILADDMGLGKTIQTLAHLQLEKKRLKKKLPPSLIVCPTSLLHNWKKEAARFTPDLKTHIHHGAQRDSDAIDHADIVLTSYGIIQRDFEQLSQKKFHLLALDEAQAVKNPNAKSAQAVRCLRADHKLCITGTPMENHLGEVWSLYDFLMPGFLGARDQFTRYYRSPIEKHNNKAQSKKLQKRIAPFMLRRSKDLVAKDLPPKTTIIRTTELNGKQRDLYETIRSSMEARVKSEIEKKGLARSQIVILDALLKMRQACCDPSLVKLEQAKEVHDSAKLDLLMTLVEPIVAEGRKILIFSQFTTMLSLIEVRLKAANIQWVKLTGQTRKRNEPIDAFQQGDIPVFLISLKAGGTGLNLTAADSVIHYDPWWNPAVEEQASDRAHRIGQDKPVFVYKLVTEGTVEEKIQELKEKKLAIAASLYGDSGKKKTQSITADDLNVLFEPIKSAND